MAATERAGELFTPPRWHLRVRHVGQNILKFIQTKPLGAMGAFIIIFMTFLAVFPYLVAPYDPLEFAGLPHASPSADFVVGTDELGRDVMSRTLWATRNSMRIGVVAVLLGKTIALIVGMMSAYFGGPVDLITQRLVDALIAFPGLIIALFWVAMFEPGVQTVTFAITIGLIPGSIRVIRSRVLSIKETTYVESARAIGAGAPRILFRHILPNVTALYMVIISLSVGGAILVESSLAFLGLGVSPENPTWGNMVQTSTKNLFLTGWWLPLPPSAGLALCVYGFNMLGDALRDVLDPRLRGSRAAGIRT